MTGRSPAAKLIGFFFLSGFVGLRAETLSVSFRAGVFLPQQQSVRDCYRTGVPAGALVRAFLALNFGMGAGFEYLAVGGQAVGLQEGGSEYPLKLRVLSVPVFIDYRLSFKRLSFFLAAGAAYHSYREKWATVPLESAGEKWSPWIALSAEQRLRRGVSLSASVSYSDIKTGKTSLLAKNVNLGGVRLMAGISLVVF